MQNCDSIEDIEQYYNRNEEQYRGLAQPLEFLISVQILKYYLKTPCKILELGSGGGSYTVFLGQLGHEVIACDLSSKLVEYSKKWVTSLGLEGRVKILCGDAREITNKVTEKFDVVLIQGPLYHLINESERVNLLKSVHKLLNPKGFLFTAHLSRLGFFSYMLAKHPQWLKDSPQEAIEIWQKGYLLNHPRNGSFRGYFCRAVEIFPFLESGGFAPIKLHGLDHTLAAQENLFTCLPDSLKDFWSDFLFCISSDRSSIESARHLMAVSQSP